MLVQSPTAGLFFELIFLIAASRHQQSHARGTRNELPHGGQQVRIVLLGRESSDREEYETVRGDTELRPELLASTPAMLEQPRVDAVGHREQAACWGRSPSLELSSGNCADVRGAGGELVSEAVKHHAQTTALVAVVCRADQYASRRDRAQN